ATFSHSRPFQCSTRVRCAAPSVKLPTAQALVFEVTPTLCRTLVKPGSGLCTRAHLVPFQCRMNDSMSVPDTRLCPTAQALLADVAATPNRSSLTPGLGLDCWLQLRPSQCRIRLRLPCAPTKNPTAQASLADTARTARRSSEMPPGLGLSTCC